MAINIAHTGNPALSESRFAQYRGLGVSTDLMTMQGAVNKTGILLLITMITAGYVWETFFSAFEPNVASVSGLMMVGAIGGFVVAMVTVFKDSWSPVTAPVYAALEGLFLGGVSAVAESQYPGIGIQAVGLTFGVFFVMLALYSSGIIKVTDKFRLGVVAATGGIAIFYFISLILSMFGVHVPLINDNSWAGIGFSLVVVSIAALNLVLDFDVIEQLSRSGAPRYMEWYAAFGLMVTLVWLYIELLRLLMKLRSER
ncbi:MAG: Bax inhibitor-1/YccA family protein [Desulfomonilaceae bacterium]